MQEFSSRIQRCLFLRSTRYLVIRFDAMGKLLKCGHSDDEIQLDLISSNVVSIFSEL